MALLSVITVCFNSEKTIERTLSSVLRQSFKDYEYIIVDGGSTDSTIEIIKQYESLFEERMKWISEPDKGIYDAFNKGIARSSGLYTWIVNSDDYLEPDALQYISGVIDAFDNGQYPIISMAMNYREEETGKIICKEFISAPRSAHCYQTDSTGVVHPATLVPLQIYRKWGTFDDKYKLIGDCDWFHRIYEKGEKILFLDKVITNMSNAGISGQWSWKRFKISFKDRQIYFPRFYSSFFECYSRFLIWSVTVMFVMLKKKIVG